MTLIEHPPTPLPLSGIYRTSDVNSAPLLTALCRLKFVEPRFSNRPDFYFDDPNNEGTTIATEYLQRDSEVGARSMFECRSQLVSEATREGGK